MVIKASSWAKYREKLAKINQKAADDMAAFLESIGGYHGHENEVIDFAFALANKYGDAAGALAADFYDEIARAARAPIPSAEIAPPPRVGEVAKAVKGTAKQGEAVIPHAVARLVKMRGCDTVLNNSIRDGAEFAWIPAGDTCAFCLTLASRGWQRASKKALSGGHAEHVHANCDCTYCVRFDSRMNVEGYDPDKYLKMYDDAEGATPQEKINTMRRELNQD